MSTSKVTPEDFVRAWQAADSVQAVIDATSLSYLAVTKRASDYRKKGVNLKKMTHGRRSIDVDALNELCQSTSETGQETSSD